MKSRQQPTPLNRAATLAPEPVQTVIDPGVLDGATSLSRRGDDLLIEYSNGSSRIFGGFFRASVNVDWAQSDALAIEFESLLAGLANGLHASILVAQAPGAATVGVTPGTVEPDTTIIARVVSTNGDVQVQRGQELVTLRTGDALREGDVIQTGTSGELRFELLSRSDASVGSGAVGENAKITLGRQAADQTAPAQTGASPAPAATSFKVDAGAVVFDRLSDAGAPVQIVTPAGAVLAQRQAVGISVNSQSGETTVMSMAGQAVASGGQAVPPSVVVQTQGAPVGGLSVPVEGLVLRPASSGATAAVSAAVTSTQATPITRLMSSPTAVGAADGATALAASSTVLASQGFRSTASLSSGLSGVLSGAAPISGGTATFSGNSGAALISSAAATSSSRLDSGVNAVATVDTRPSMPATAAPPPAPAKSAPPLETGPGAGNDTVRGGDGPDAIDAGAGNDWVSGGSGGDTVIGSEGDDTVFGDAGDDVLEGDTGNDQIEGGLGSDTVRGGEGNDSAGGGEGSDSVSGGSGDDTVNGGDGNDILSGDAGNDTLDGGTGDDTVSSSEGNDSASGGDGNDAVSGGNGSDTVSGGDGNDTLSGENGNDTVSGGNGNDTVSGGNGNDTVSGDNGNDSLSGDAGDDTLSGGNGNDTRDGGSGADTLLGGNDDDVLVFDANDVLMDGGLGNDTLLIRDVSVDLTTLPDGQTLNVETIRLDSSSSQTLTLKRADVVAMLESSNTTMRVEGSAGDQLVFAEVWTIGSPTVLDGTTYNQYTNNGYTVLVNGGVTVRFLLQGGASAETLTGSAGYDTVSGGDGNDTLSGENGN
ncbi:MAG: hypothetical protein RI906_1295, partial [Pseudomonadota bacterium]